MKALVVSDLHLEFSTLDLDVSGVDIVLLAGDIHLGTRAFPWIQAQCKDLPVIYVPGNHEFYRGEYSRVLRDLRASAAKMPNVHLLDKESLVIGDIEFLGAILWTDFALNGDTPEEVRIAESYAATRLTDFTGTIRFEEHGNFRRFRPSDTALLHAEAKAWLASCLYEPSEKKRVVITHHLPSAHSVAPRFQNDQLSPAFASRLDPLVELADVWIHGHTHDSFDYHLGKCRVVCNPRGYVVAGRPPENVGFNPRWVTDL
ncbi:metallophosphoesterase [Chromobacterium haemolyticum]|uniref:metallophosphoesterase n=1 Tax=Chromobacterium haemolyticum TaxID=394935 RepID=UPI00244C5FEB|nr:metallophosphoesterase [Chromobacterium haemolyticum]MDH0341624.1 metallophosphoesterase [Chromobacterium haemolyticum]